VKKNLINSYIYHGLSILIIFLYLSLISSEHSTLITNSILITIFTYTACTLLLPKLTRYLLVEREYYILPVFTTVVVSVIVVIIALRIDYSRFILLHGFSVTFIGLYLSALLRKSEKKLKLNAINNFNVEALNKHKNIDIKALTSPYNIKDVRQGLVVDLHQNLSAEEGKFIADCSINNISVFHSESIQEMLEGKVQTTHLSENAIGTLLPNPIYIAFKHCLELLLVIASFPITLPIMLITAILIKIENSGPAIFTQERVGQGGKVFKIYKFRSMTVQPKHTESKFATEEQARVTKIGKVIRKVRIDELPQFFNVIKGEMALIGPRPEQESFVKEFEKNIPFYGYRHMVKPGITGWAQTVQGYTADTDSTREKLAHDLYYIKHLSFWLDANIVFKTIRTMLTGFGAK
jgi:exopolysaccharide biosynthesis polyprenyl glycosylphosphotransferase